MDVDWSRHSRGAIGIIVAAMAAAACSGTSATGPTTIANARLIARFDSLAKTSQPLHTDQLRAVITRLASGAPVGHVQVMVDGHASRYSIVAVLDVRDTSAVPVDSLLTMFAWSGEDADTLIEFDVGNRDAILLTDPVSLILSGFVPAPTGVMTSAPAGVCPTVQAVVPPGSGAIRGDKCGLEKVSIAVSVTFDAAPEPDPIFELPVQPITAIRQEFFESSRWAIADRRALGARL